MHLSLTALFLRCLLVIVRVYFWEVFFLFSVPCTNCLLVVLCVNFRVICFSIMCLLTVFCWSLSAFSSEWFVFVECVFYQLCVYCLVFASVLVCIYFWVFILCVSTIVPNLNFCVLCTCEWLAFVVGVFLHLCASYCLCVATQIVILNLKWTLFPTRHKGFMGSMNNRIKEL